MPSMTAHAWKKAIMIERCVAGGLISNFIMTMLLEMNKHSFISASIAEEFIRKERVAMGVC